MEDNQLQFNYQEYFRKIKPKTQLDVYNRFLFAFCSVHTTWERNVIGYNMVKGIYHTDKKSLRKLIKKSGIGLTNNRTAFILEFTQKYLENPKFYTKRRAESWVKYAERLIKDIKGLGLAKARFAIELIYPNSARIVCADTHIIQWAKQNPEKMNKTLYMKIEQGFLNHSKKQNKHPIEARWSWWDKKQGYTDPRYWSWCLE